MKIKTIFKLLKTAIPVLFLPLMVSKAFALSITDINFSSLSGDVTEVRLDFDGQPPEITGYTIEKPARIAIDLPNTQSALTSKRHDIGMGNTRSATLVSAKDRSRLVINLNRAVGYTTKISGNTLVLRIGQTEEVQPVVSTTAVAQASATAPVALGANARVVNVDFRRGELGEGQIQIMLSDPRASASITREGRRIVAVLENVQLPTNLSRRLDVVDFSTPVRFVDASTVGKTTRIVIEPINEDFEYLAYQKIGRAHV